MSLNSKSIAKTKPAKLEIDGNKIEYSGNGYLLGLLIHIKDRLSRQGSNFPKLIYTKHSSSIWPHAWICSNMATWNTHLPTTASSVHYILYTRICSNLDFTKAFILVDHTNLITKMTSTDIRQCISWVNAAKPRQCVLRLPTHHLRSPPRGEDGPTLLHCPHQRRAAGYPFPMKVRGWFHKRYGLWQDIPRLQRPTQSHSLGQSKSRQHQPQEDSCHAFQPHHHSYPRSHPPLGKPRV